MEVKPSKTRWANYAQEVETGDQGKLARECELSKKLGSQLVLFISKLTRISEAARGELRKSKHVGKHTRTEVSLRAQLGMRSEASRAT